MQRRGSINGLARGFITDREFICRRSAELRIRRQKAGGNARGSASVSTRGSAPRRRRAPTPGELLPLLHCTSVTVLGQVAVRCAGHRRCPNSSTVTDSASAAAALHKEVSRTRCEVPAGLRRPPSAGAGLAGEDRRFDRRTSAVSRLPATWITLRAGNAFAFPGRRAVEDHPHE